MTTCPHCEHANAASVVVCAGCGSLLPGAEPAFTTASGETEGELAACSTPFPGSKQEVASHHGSTATTRSLRKLAPISTAARETDEFSGAPSALTVPGGAKISNSSLATHVGTTNNYASTAPITIAADALPPVEPAPVAQPRLVVVRGERVNVAYAILEGKNYVGRSADKPVDIDLDGQEAVERIWTSRQHAVITFERGRLVIEDLNSLNGSFVNRARLHPGTAKALAPGDVLQFGTVQLKVMV